MKRKNKITNVITKLLALVVFMTVSTVGLTFTKASAATDEVSLYSQDSRYLDSAAGWSITQLTAMIKVKDIAYDKKVSIHYRDYYSDWKDMDATFDSKLDNGYELWKVTPIYRSTYIEYAIKYEVNGQTYWDNNNGKNYFAYWDNKTAA